MERVTLEIHADVADALKDYQPRFLKNRQRTLMAAE